MRLVLWQASTLINTDPIIMTSDNKNDTRSSVEKTDSTAKAADSKTTAGSVKTSSDTAAKPDTAAKKVPPVLSDTVTPPPASSKTESTSAQQNSAKATQKAAPGKQPPADTSPNSSRKHRRSSRVISWLALLIALLALAGVVYGLWILQQEKDTKISAQSRLNKSQSELSDSVNSRTQALSDQLQGFVRNADSQQTEIAELQTQLQATNRQVGEVTQVSRRSWMLAEAEYLLRLANQRLMMERETASALTLLNSVDKILASVAEPGLFEVRETLARETAALRGIAPLDVEGVFLKLAALGEQVESLQLLNPDTETKAETQTETTTATPNEAPQSVMDAALERFGKMVKIRQRDEPLAPLLTPEQHYYLQQNLRLMLEQAQLALLQRKAGVYDRSLEKASDWIEQYFQLNVSAQAIQSTLGELQQVQINPDLPDISASLALLKAYISKPSPGDASPPVIAPDKTNTTSAEEPTEETGAAQ